MRRVGITVALLLGWSACDGPRRQAIVPRTSPAARPAPRRQAAPPRRSPPSPPQSQLDRRDPVPPGVAPFYQPQMLSGYGRAGVRRCPVGPTQCVNGRCRVLGTVRVYPRGDVLLAGLSRVTVCVDGVTPGQRVTVDIASPTGRRTTVSRASGSRAFRQEMILPPGPAGPYQVTARTGTRTHRAKLTARAVRRPRLRAAPQVPRAGDALTLAVAGLPPSQSTELHVYWIDKGPRYLYRTTLILSADAHGIAQLRLQTQPGDNTGRYYFGRRAGKWLGYVILDPAPKSRPKRKMK